MEKRRRNLAFSIILMGVLFIIAGIVNSMLFKDGHYQELISTHNSMIAVITFLSIIVFGLGASLILFCLEIAEKTENFFEGWNALEILFYIGGSLLVLIGIGNLIFFGSDYYQELSLVSPIKYFTIMVLSFLFIYFGFFVSRFRIIVSGWITESFKRKKQPRN